VSASTTALTCQGLVGLDWTRMTLIPVGTGYMFRRADGSKALIAALPSKFRTCGDITSVAASEPTLLCNVSCIPSAWNDAEGNAHALPAHAWKGTMTFAVIAKQFKLTPAQVKATRATYKALKG